jgi:hypothetical protein
MKDPPALLVLSDPQDLRPNDLKFLTKQKKRISDPTSYYLDAADKEGAALPARLAPRDRVAPLVPPASRACRATRDQWDPSAPSDRPDRPPRT